MILCCTLVLLADATAAQQHFSATTYLVEIDATQSRGDVAQTLVGIETEAVGHSFSGGGLSSQMLTDASFEDIRDDPSMPQPPSNIPACNGTCHWKYNTEAAISTSDAFNGNRSLLLKPKARVMTAGLYGRGLSLIPNATFSGYFFAKTSSMPSSGYDELLSMSLAAESACSTQASDENLASNITARFTMVTSEMKFAGGWSMVNISVVAVQFPVKIYGCLIISSIGSVDVAVDQIYLENSDALWRNDARSGFGPGTGLHLRKDVTDSLLLTDDKSGAVGLQALRLNGGMVNNQNYVWKNHRGPTWLRPEAYFNGTGGSWYKYASHDYAMFEALTLAEIAGIPLVMLGVNVYYETPASIADLMEYMFGADSTVYGRLRSEDGHPSPFNASSIIIELGNEETHDNYWDKAHPILITMRSTCAGLMGNGTAANGQDLSQLRFSVMYAPWSFSPGLNSTKAQIATDTAPFARQMLWDQHDGSDYMNWVDVDMHSHDGMLEFLRPRGWNQQYPIIVGETNCNKPPGICSSTHRALVYALTIAEAVRSGYVQSIMPAVWAYASCNSTLVCGGADGQPQSWPQYQLILTPDSVVRQPSWYAHQMISHSWGTELLSASPNYTVSGPVVFDILALKDAKNRKISIQVIHGGSNSTAMLNLKINSPVCGGTVESTVLSDTTDAAVNTQLHPNQIRPKSGTVVVQPSGAVSLTLAPNSLTVFSIPTKCT